MNKPLDTFLSTMAIGLIAVGIVLYGVCWLTWRRLPVIGVVALCVIAWRLV